MKKKEEKQKDGRVLSTKQLQKIIERKDKTIKSAIGRALSLADDLKEFKTKLYGNVDSILRAQGIKPEELTGNFTFTSTDGLMKITFKCPNRIAFTEGLNVAKNMILELIEKWTEESNKNIKKIIDRTFAIDKKGNVDKTMILDLKNLGIKNEIWQEAMQKIDESIVVETGKQYATFQLRKDERSDWKTIDLSFSSMEVKSE